MNIDQLQAYSDAWNEHDIDTVMAYMTDDCVFETGGGTERYGTRHVGYETVREKFVGVWTDVPDVQFINARHFISGERGCSEWTIVGTTKDGNKMELVGCELFSFANGKIKLKNSFIKNRK